MIAKSWEAFLAKRGRPRKPGKRHDDNQPSVGKLTTPEMRQHGAYVADFTKIGGRLTRVVRNQGGSAIERWLSAGHPFGEPQVQAVRFCQRLWEIMRDDVSNIRSEGGLKIWVKANGQVGWTGQSQQDAMDQIARFEAMVGSRPWQVFESAARFEHNGADSGRELADSPRRAARLARDVTAQVASQVAGACGY